MICDAPGTGKSICLLLNILGTHWYQTHKGVRPTKPVLVVVPTSLKEKTYDDLREGLGVHWKVIKCSKAALVQAYGTLPVKLDSNNWAFQPINGDDPSQHVVLMSTDDMSAAHGDVDLGTVNDLFERGAIDEGHGSRFVEVIKRGRLLLAMQLRFLALYTPTPFINTVLDLGGYLALLQKRDFTLCIAGQATDAQIQTWNTLELVQDFTS